MTSQGVKLIMLLMLATLMLNSLHTTAAAVAAAESNNRNSHHHHHHQHHDEKTEKSQEYAKAITATATESAKVVEEQQQHMQRRHHQRHHNHKQYLTRESATNYHQQKQQNGVQHDNNNNNKKQSVNITQMFETQTHKEHRHHQQQQQHQENAHQTNVEHRKQQHHHQEHHQQQHHHHHHQHHHQHEHDHQQHENKHIQQSLSNHDRHSRALYFDLKHNNKLHLTASAPAPAPAPATTTEPSDESLLHLTLNQANEDKLAYYNDIAKTENPATDDDDDNDDNDDYDDYDNYDYDDEALVAVDLEDRRHFAHKMHKQSPFASNNRVEAAFAARRVPRDHHNVATRWNAINIDSSNRNSNEEDYPSDQPSDEPAGAITQQKINELGTAERAEVEYKKYLLRKRAQLHQLRINKEASCSQPKPRVIYIRKKTTDQYFPSATILHRCDESSGCCPLPRHICGPKTTQIVSLPFEVAHSFNGPKEPVEVSLLNHTDCYCDEPSKFGNDLQMRRKRSYIHIVAPLKVNTLSTHTQGLCRCPKHFERVKESDRQYNLDDYDYSGINSEAVSSTPATKKPKCSCDCHPSDNHLVCQRMKNGEEGFAVLDRKCISNNECSPPICSHGIYNRQVGRCPHANSNQRTNYEHSGWRHYSFD